MLNKIAIVDARHPDHSIKSLFARITFDPSNERRLAVEAACANSGVPKTERDLTKRFSRIVWRLEAMSYKGEIENYRPGHVRRALIRATRLWNWIDHQDEPEPLWDFLADVCPWAFTDCADTNSIILQYA